MAKFEPFQLYWRLYGGSKGLAQSPYLWAAALLTGVCWRLWQEQDFFDGTRPGTSLMLSIVPALMAFTLAGMAIVLALSGRRFVDAIREGGAEDSLFMKAVALFFHFLIVQTLAVIFALVSRTYPSSDALAGVSFFLGSYGLTSAVAIGAMLLNVSRIYNFTGGDDEGS